MTYEAAQIIFNAIETTKSSDPAKIRDVIQNLKDFQSVTAKISFDKDGDPIKSAAVLQIKDKKQVFVTSVTP